jgi:hypothetical protein
MGQVYCLGLSIDKACSVMAFFQQLKLRKSQADALLNRLAAAWEGEFDHLCTLLANSAVVHADETSWSINSVWAFLNDKLTVLFYGPSISKVTWSRNLFAGFPIQEPSERPARKLYESSSFDMALRIPNVLRN